MDAHLYQLSTQLPDILDLTALDAQLRTVLPPPFDGLALLKEDNGQQLYLVFSAGTGAEYAAAYPDKIAQAQELVATHQPPEPVTPTALLTLKAAVSTAATDAAVVQAMRAYLVALEQPISSDTPKT